MKMKVSIHEGMTNAKVVIIEPVRRTAALAEIPAKWGIQFSDMQGWVKYPSSEGPTFVQCSTLVKALRFADEYFRTGRKSGAVIQ